MLFPVLPPRRSRSLIPQSCIHLKVRDEEGNSVSFKLRTNTPLKKLMDIYAARWGARSDNFRFMFGGERLNETDTAEHMKMDDGDCIDSLLQLGGPHTGPVVPLKLNSNSSRFSFTLAAT